MIKMKGKQKNNLNLSKEMSLNLKISSKNNNNTFLKANNVSLDFTSSPIKNNKKVIKRNTRTNSYNSFLYNQTENYITNKNPFNSGIISFDSKINLKKNIFTFSNAKQNLFDNSKNKNNNQKKNKKNKKNEKNNKTKNITAHQSTSNLKKFNINTDTNLNININNSNDKYINTNPNITSSFILNRKNQKINNHSHFHNYIKDNNFYSFSLQEKSDKFYFRNMNNTSKNLLFLTKPNINSKQFQTKNKTLLYKKSKQKNQEIKPNKKYLEFTKTTKNSEDKKNKVNMNRMSSNNINNNIVNLLELSNGKLNNEYFYEYDLLYNCLKKKNDAYKNYNKEYRSKSGRKNKKRKKYSLFEEDIFHQDSLMGIIYENKQIKQRNEELSKQFEIIKIEFEQMKKDNKDIKEELKEKSKYLKDIKLTMDIFSQELLKLQNIYKDNDNYNDDKIINPNKNNTNLKENDENKERQNIIIEINNNNNSKINNDNNDKESINSFINNTNSNNESDINNKNNIIFLSKKNKLEKIHQLSLNNINNLINQQNKKRGGSLEANNFQDTSKIINNETKDATEKDNECLNDKWPSPLYIEKKEKEKEINNEINKEDEESIEFTNISLADNLNINEEVYKNALNVKKNNIGKLDFENKLINKNNEDNKDNINKISQNLNCINQEVANDNFNEEFLKYYDKFSDSWRKEVDKMLKKVKE